MQVFRNRNSQVVPDEKHESKPGLKLVIGSIIIVKTDNNTLRTIRSNQNLPKLSRDIDSNQPRKSRNFSYVCVCFREFG